MLEGATNDSTRSVQATYHKRGRHGETVSVQQTDRIASSTDPQVAALQGQLARARAQVTALQSEHRNSTPEASSSLAVMPPRQQRKIADTIETLEAHDRLFIQPEGGADAPLYSCGASDLRQVIDGQVPGTVYVVRPLQAHESGQSSSKDDGGSSVYWEHNQYVRERHTATSDQHSSQASVDYTSYAVRSWSDLDVIAMSDRQGSPIEGLPCVQLPGPRGTAQISAASDSSFSTTETQKGWYYYLQTQAAGQEHQS